MAFGLLLVSLNFIFLCFPLLKEGKLRNVGRPAYAMIGPPLLKQNEKGRRNNYKGRNICKGLANTRLLQSYQANTLFQSDDRVARSLA